MIKLIKLIGLAMLGVFAYGIVQAIIHSPKTSGKSDPNSPPSDQMVSNWFLLSLRKELRDPDSYKAGKTRRAAHPDGYAYFHEFRARNGFGGMMQSECGLLYNTNTQQAVFYAPSESSTLLAEVVAFALKNAEETKKAPPSSAVGRPPAGGARQTKGESRAREKL